MKNIRTPRTLAESEFVTGYSSAQLLEVESRVHAAMYVLAAVFFAALAAGYIVQRWF